MNAAVPFDPASITGATPARVARRTTRRIEAHTTSFSITEARYAPRARLALHFHDRPSVVLITSGTCVSELAHASLDLTPGDVVVEPAGETHRNRFDGGGTSVIIVQPDGERDTFDPCADFLATAGRTRHFGVRTLASRLHTELTAPDELSPLALDAAALELLTAAARAPHARVDRRWLATLVEFMHEEFLKMPTMRELSAVAGIHPAHLSRAFRQAHGVSPVTYLRRLRIEWAADQLRATQGSLTDIAAAAGFADQSHFTRVFRRWLGHTPQEHRQR